MARNKLDQTRDTAAQDRIVCRVMRPDATDAEVYAFAAERMANRATRAWVEVERVKVEFADYPAGRGRMVRIYQNEARRCEQVAAEMAALADDLRT